MTVDLILASASPRRRESLEQIGLRLIVAPVDIDETPRPGEVPREYASRVAEEKCAKAVVLASQSADTTVNLPAGLPILAADTTVVIDGVILGKPRDADDAGAMLRRLAGRRHEVITAFAIRHGERSLQRAVSTQVSMRLIDAKEVEAYVASREWTDKAGGYAIQGRAALFVTDVRGSFTNVIGLPLAEVIADLRALEALPGFPPAAFGAT